MARTRDSILLAALSLSGVVTIAACRGASDDGAAGSPNDLIVSDDLVIRQIYGGGGNTGSPLKNDFVELFNRGSAPVSLAEKSLQYAKADGDFSATSGVLALPADVMLQPGQSFLVKMKSSGDVGAELGATPDFSPAAPLSLGNASGKVAIAPSGALLEACGSAAAPCVADKYIDLIGYGTASQAEGTAVGALSNTMGALRKNNGCADTGDNATDFEIVAPSFRNAASAATPCDPDAGPAPGEAGAEDAASETDASSGADAGSDAAPAQDAAPMGVSLVLLNEIKINPPGNTDTPWEYAEIACPPNGSLAGYYFVAFEGDGDSSTGSPGVADIVVDLGTQKCGSNGIAVIKPTTGGHAFGAQATVFTTASLDTGSGFENATTSFAIVRSPSTPIVQGADYDAADEGTLSLPGGASIVDGISVFDQTDGVTDHTYVPRLAKAGIVADAASRFPGVTAPLSESAWYFGDLKGANPDSLEYDPAKASINLPANAALTPGMSNVGTPAPAPVPGGGSGDDDPSKPVDTGEEDPGGDEPTGPGSSTGDTPRSPGRAAPLPSSPSTNSSASCAAAPAPASYMAGLAAMLVALVSLASRRKRSR
jgi:hypothetical protein